MSASADLAPRPSRNPVTRADRACRVISWDPWPFENDHLVGHCTVDFNGWQVHRVPIFRRKDGELSAGVPSAPQLDRDGVQLRDANGKRKYSAVISFAGDGKARWEAAILGALAEAGIVL